MLETKNMGKRRMIQGSWKRVSQRPMNSVFHEGFFMRMTLVPSSRMTLSALTMQNPRTRPMVMRTMKPT
jgi:hypothetical protein